MAVPEVGQVHMKERREKLAWRGTYRLGRERPATKALRQGFDRTPTPRNPKREATVLVWNGLVQDVQE